MRVSAAILTRNSADVIRKCLKSLKGIDEIVIVDTGSRDNTKEICAEYTDKIYDFWECNEKNDRDGLLMDFSKARNFAISKCTQEYILTIDSDEYLEPGAMAVIREFGGRALLFDVIGDKSGETHQQPRLYINAPDVYWERPIHNYLNVPGDYHSEKKIHFAQTNKQKQSDPDRTMRILKRWIKKNPRDCTRERYYLAKEYHKRNMYKEAVRQFSKYIQKTEFLPEKADALVNMSRCYAGLNRREEAIGAVMAAMNINPNFREALELMGELSDNPARLVWKYHASNTTNYNVLFNRPRKRLRVTVLSKIDFAGSGMRIAESVMYASGGGIDIEPITYLDGVGNEKWGIETGPSVEMLGRKVVEQRLQDSDIIHFKGDWPHNGSFEGIPLPKGKRIVQTFCGSIFRRKKEGLPDSVAWEQYPLYMYRGDYLSAFTPEMLYHKKIHLMPFPWFYYDYRFKKGKKFRIMHIPSTPEKKGTDIILKGVKLLNRKDIELVAVKDLAHAQVMELKGSAHIYIDQMVLPVYGNSAVEAMSMGIPVLSWDEGLYPDETPIIKPENKSPEAIAMALDRHLRWDKLNELSQETFKYCQNVHGTMGKKWGEVYKKLYKE